MMNYVLREFTQVTGARNRMRTIERFVNKTEEEDLTLHEPLDLLEMGGFALNWMNF